MKKFKLNFIIIALLSFTFKGFSQNLDEIISKHIEAIGGRANWEKINSLRTESVMKAQGAEIKFTGIILNKKASRSDIFVMGMKGFNILTTNQGWNFAPWQGQAKSEAMTEDDVKNSQDELEILEELMTYKEKGNSIDYYGMDDIDGTECHKIKMTTTQDKEITFYIDPSNYMIIKRTKKVKSNGQENEMSTYFSDYKKLPEGIVFPMSSSSGWSESEITKLEINPKIEESLFKPEK